MSQLNVDTIKKADGTGNLSVPAETGTVVTTASPSLGRRNLIINGAMQVAQRGTSTTATGYLLDRWKLETANTDQFAFTMSQSPTAPSGFSSSLKIDTTTPETALDTDEYIRLLQRIEAQDLQQLGYGTADAQSVTLSFWARSNLTTAFAVVLYAEDGGRIIGSTFTPSAADTWEQFSITLAGDTSGTINNDTGSGLSLEIYLAAGSLWTGTDNTSWGAFANGKLANGIVSNIGSSTSNDFYITGVQLEVGTFATSFEHRSFGEELALCQRYYTKSYGYGVNPGTASIDGSVGRHGVAGTGTTGEMFTSTVFKVEMRGIPTVLAYDMAGNSGKCAATNFGVVETQNNTCNEVHIQTSGCHFQRPSGGDTACAITVHYTADAEL